MVPAKFREELTQLINKHSVEQCGDVPAYILAQHLCDCIEALHATMDRRDKWYGVDRRKPIATLE